MESRLPQPSNCYKIALPPRALSYSILWRRLGMSDARERLVKCFSAVFPTLDTEAIQLANPTTVAKWDSLASITLISVIEEEFQVQIDPEHIEHLVSFEKVFDYITSRIGSPN